MLKNSLTLQKTAPFDQMIEFFRENFRRRSLRRSLLSKFVKKKVKVSENGEISAKRSFSPADFVKFDTVAKARMNTVE